MSCYVWAWVGMGAHMSCYGWAYVDLKGKCWALLGSQITQVTPTFWVELNKNIYMT